MDKPKMPIAPASPEREGVSRYPRKAQGILGGKDAWWYENATSIEVFIQNSDSTRVIGCRIPRRTLAAWIARTETKRR